MFFHNDDAANTYLFEARKCSIAFDLSCFLLETGHFLYRRYSQTLTLSYLFSSHLNCVAFLSLRSLWFFFLLAHMHWYSSFHFFSERIYILKIGNSLYERDFWWDGLIFIFSIFSIKRLSVIVICKSSWIYYLLYCVAWPKCLNSHSCTVPMVSFLPVYITTWVQLHSKEIHPTNLLS